VRELQAPGSPVLDKIRKAFGDEIIDDSGALDREALAAVVFRDAEARARLGAIVHPEVGVETVRRLAAAREAGAPVVVLDIPLLFEGRKAGTGSAAQMDFDSTVLVYAPEALQIERQMTRDGCDREEALRRIRAQLPIEEKRQMADCVIDNSGTREQTERQVSALWPTLTTTARAGEF
jgi:dephospho-CoA kinase